MATYTQIQKHIKENYNVSVKSCWIAHVKEMNGLIDKNSDRKNPCPKEKTAIIEESLKFFGMVS